MSPDSKSYVPKKLRRLAMLAEEIQTLEDTTPQKARRIMETFEEALHSPVGCAIKISKPNDELRVTEWEYDCLAVLDLFWKSVKKDIQDMVTYTQQLRMAQEFHSEDIKLILEEVIKHFL